MRTRSQVLFSMLIAAPALTLVVAAQEPEAPPVKRGNFGYSQNPSTKSKAETTPTPAGERNPETIARKTLEVARKANRTSVSPTEHYKVGIGDVLLVRLQNNAQSAAFYTVLNDGTLDYPLAGEMVAVEGLTTEEIEEALASRIKLYENPDVTVTVRDYASHRITVLGLVERAGERFIQREAVPLFVIRAEALVRPEANRVVIQRANGKSETVPLSDESLQATLVFPGDAVEFAGPKPGALAGGRFFYIGGGVNAGGRKDFYDGLTLTQAILEAGGLRKDSLKKVIIRRQNAEGLLVSTEVNLKQVKAGKVADPVLAAGDTIEILD